jgi:hypothetical protein
VRSAILSLVIHREPQFVSAGNSILMPVAPLRAKNEASPTFLQAPVLALLLGLALRLFCLRHFFPDVGAGGIAEFFLGFLLHRTPMVVSRPQQGAFCESRGAMPIVSFMPYYPDEKVDRTAANFHLWNWWGHREKRVLDKYFGLYAAIRINRCANALMASHLFEPVEKNGDRAICPSGNFAALCPGFSRGTPILP